MLSASKGALHRLLRGAHVRMLDRGLPSRLGIYLHSLDPAQYPALRAMVAELRSRGYRFVGPEAFLANEDAGSDARYDAEGPGGGAPTGDAAGRSGGGTPTGDSAGRSRGGTPAGDAAGRSGGTPAGDAAGRSRGTPAGIAARHARDQSTGRAFLSFDDNYRDWYEALPVFDELELRATFYVNTGAFRDRATPEAIRAYYTRLEHTGPHLPLSTSELREMADAGHVIGAHTHTHERLTSLPRAEAQQEIARSKRELEAILGRAVVHFSYPFGMRRHFDEHLRAYCRDLGFETVANAIPGMQHAAQRPYHLNRSPWDLERGVDYNLANLGVDGRLFARLTGRSAVG